MEEGNSMVRIDSETRSGITSEGAFGSLAVLLVGFMREDVASFHALMAEMEAEAVKVCAARPKEAPRPCNHACGGVSRIFPSCPQVVPCSKALLKGTLQAAMEVEEVPAYEQVRRSLRADLCHQSTS